MQVQIIKEFNELVVEAYLDYSNDMPCPGDMVAESKFGRMPAIKNCFEDMYACNKVQLYAADVLDALSDDLSLQYKRSDLTISILEREQPLVHALCVDIYSTVDMLCTDGLLTTIIDSMTFADLVRYTVWAYRCRVKRPNDREYDSSFGVITFSLPDMSRSLQSALKQLGLFSAIVGDKVINEPYEDFVYVPGQLDQVVESSDESSGCSSDYIEPDTTFTRPSIKRRIMLQEPATGQIWYKGNFYQDAVSSESVGDSVYDRVVYSGKRAKH